MCKPTQYRPSTDPADSDYEGSLALLDDGQPDSQEIAEAFELEMVPDCDVCMDQGCELCR